MVMQSETIDLIEELLTVGTTVTVEYGNSSSIDYADNSLDTTYETVTDVNLSVVSNKINFDSVLDSTLGNGNTINSELLTINGYAVNKNKYSDIAKTSAKIIDSRESIYIIVD